MGFMQDWSWVARTIAKLYLVRVGRDGLHRENLAVLGDLLRELARNDLLRYFVYKSQYHVLVQVGECFFCIYRDG